MKLDPNNLPNGFKINASGGTVILFPLEDCIIVTNKDTVQKHNRISVDVPKGTRFSLFCFYGISEFSAQSKPIEKLTIPDGFSPMGGIWHFNPEDIEIETHSELASIYADIKSDNAEAQLYDKLKKQSNQILFIVVEQEKGSHFCNTLEIVSTKESAIKLIENRKKFHDEHGYKPHDYRWIMHHVWELE